jgi:RNA polymerase sigma factor (sigma-70 family)
MILNPKEIRTLIRAATRTTGTPLHDEDLEQEVALLALTAFRRLHTVRHPRALLMKIVRDALSDHWRRKRCSEQLAGVDERFTSHAPALESQLDHKRRLELLRQALDRLPEAKLTVLELFYVNDHSIREIAASQNRSASAVKMELARSRRSLARIIRLLADKKA